MVSAPMVLRPGCWCWALSNFMDKYDKAEKRLDEIVANSGLTGKEQKAFSSLVNGHITMWVGYGFPMTAADEWGSLSEKYPQINTRAKQVVTRVMNEFNVPEYNWES